MAEKIEWYGEIPADVKWLTFADQRDKGYEYDNPNNAHKITATTDDNNSLPYDEIKFVVKYNSNVNSRTCEIKFTRKDGKTDNCYISQNGTTFEQIWKHAPNKNTSDATDAVITQSNNETQNDFEVAVGNYNKTRSNLLFSVGNGTASKRKNSFEVDDEKIKADNADISHLTANTICANTIVNENGTNFVSYTAATTGSEQGAYPIGTLTINDEENVIYGINRDEEAIRISQEASDEVRNLSANTVTKTDFTHYYNSCASGLTDNFSALTTTFDSFSGDIKQQISEVNSLVRTASSNTLSLSGTVTNYYNGLNGKVTGLTNSYNTLNQSLSDLTDRVGRVETEYDGVSGQVKSVKSSMDEFKVSYDGLTNKVEAIKTDYNTLNDQVSNVSKSYNELSQSLSGLREDVGHVETKYDTVSGQVQSVKSAMDAFNVSYGGLSNQVSAITTQYDNLSGQVISNRENIGTLRATSDTFLSKLDSISVGGVNLLYDTNFDTFNKSDSKWSTWGSPSTLTMTKESDGWNWISIKSTDKYQGINQNQNSRRGVGYKEFKPNTYYTFSVYAYGNSTHMDLGVHFVNETGTVNVGQVWCSNDNNYSKSWGKGVIPLTSTKTRYWFTFKTPDDSTIKYFNAMIGFGSLSTNPSSDEVINIAKPQLEEGTIPTDWKENSDDYSKDMSSKIEQTVSSITLSVQENVENKLVETGIDIKNNIINLKADTTSFLGSDGKQYIKVEKDDKGMPHLIFYGTDGTTPLYDLGYTGLKTLITGAQNGKFSSKICLIDIGEFQTKPYYAGVIITALESSTIPAYKYSASYEVLNGTTVFGNDEDYDSNYYNAGATSGSHAEDIDWLKDSNNFIPDGYYARWLKIYNQTISREDMPGPSIININCYHISKGKVIEDGSIYISGSDDTKNYYFTDKEGNSLSYTEYNYIKDYVFPKKLDI